MKLIQIKCLLVLLDKWSTYSYIKKKRKQAKKLHKRYKKDTNDIHKKMINFQLISSGKFGDKMRPSRYLKILYKIL